AAVERERGAGRARHHERGKAAGAVDAVDHHPLQTGVVDGGGGGRPGGGGYRVQGPGRGTSLGGEGPQRLGGAPGPEGAGQAAEAAAGGGDVDSGGSGAGDERDRRGRRRALHVEGGPAAATSHRQARGAGVGDGCRPRDLHRGGGDGVEGVG